MITLTFEKNGRFALGVKTEKGILDVEEALNVFTESYFVPVTVKDLIIRKDEAKKAIEKLYEQIKENEQYFLEEDKLIFGPCVLEPQKIICIGLNYKRHADECKLPYPSEPIIFGKFNNALHAHQKDIQLPKNSSQIDYEGELAIVIGKEAKNVKKEEAYSYIYGYCNANDLSARDLQFKTSQWLIGKTVDGFCPIGPYLVSNEEIENPNNLRIRTYVNGEIRQDSNTYDMIFNCDEIIQYVSQHMTLYPGDIILTGTPEGVIVGYPEEERIWLKDGDTVTVEIEGLGRLSNTFQG